MEAKNMRWQELLHAANKKHQATHKGSKMKDPDALHPAVQQIMSNDALSPIQKAVLINEHHAKQTQKVSQILNNLNPQNQM